MAYLLRFNGVNDRVLLSSEISLQSGDAVNFTVSSFTGAAGQNRYLMDSGALTRAFVIVRSDGTMRFNTSVISSLLIDGSAATDQVTVFPTDGLDHEIVINISSSCGMSRIGSAQNYLERWNADIKRITVSRNSSLIHDYLKESLVGSNDTTWNDRVGSNNGNLLNFPTDNSQWVFYSAPSAGVTADVTESTTDFSESSNLSLTVNITAQITEASSDFLESSSASFTATLSAQVTEVNASFTESSSATITNNIVSVLVTETSQYFSESSSASISWLLSAAVTELSQSFTESSTADISANISAAVTELAQDFDEYAQVNLVGRFTVEVTETTSDFEDACYIQLPVQRLIPRKTISVSNRSGSTIRVRSRNNVIRVK